METRTLEASIGPLLTQHRNEAYLFTALEPVIYRIIPGSAVPFLKFDFGKYNVPESYWETENAMQAFTDLSQKGFISIAGFMMNDDYIVTELNQQTGMEDSSVITYWASRNGITVNGTGSANVQKKIN